MQRLYVQLSLVARPVAHAASTSEAQVLLDLLEVARERWLRVRHQPAEVATEHNLPVVKLVGRCVRLGCGWRRCGAPVLRREILERSNALRRDAFLPKSERKN